MSLDVRRGETLAVVGESGSGKSPLARLVLRLDEPTSGGISFEGQDITHVKGVKRQQLRRRFQMIYQSPSDSLNRVCRSSSSSLNRCCRSARGSGVTLEAGRRAV